MESLSDAHEFGDTGVVAAQVLHEYGHRAGLQAFWIIDAVEQFTDHPKGDPCGQQHSDLPNLYDDRGLEQALARAGAPGRFITSRPGEFAPAGERDELEVLVKVTDPVQAPTGPISLDVIRHERHLPDIKHVGEISKTLLLRQANARGFDDAAFLDRGGRLSEATIWNLAYWDGASVIWPEAEYLHGVTMQILARQLRALGVPQQTRAVRPTEIDERWSAAVMNSWTPGIPVSRIGDRQLVQEPAFPRLLHRAWARDSQNQLA
ncbi:aminotransferase class IV [Streptomyces sp. XM4193]|uniref:aminotransferase class IV n=1 Tax=Streptomyces sp. XM4193 TaxID=2929782 RepID=UPI001FF852FB|nr:aminotransferase class IV [Streptomyces sp. XM4193]MCK1795871.1 aminotransferase class IV [Streptomyces sp. XM4193]